MNRLDEIEARAKAATPGKWRVGWPSNEGEDKQYILQSKGSKSNDVNDWVLIVRGVPDDWGTPNGVLKPEDATFIAAARTDVPLLIHALRQLGNERNAIKENDPDIYMESPVMVDSDVLELVAGIAHE